MPRARAVTILDPASQISSHSIVAARPRSNARRTRAASYSGSNSTHALGKNAKSTSGTGGYPGRSSGLPLSSRIPHVSGGIGGGSSLTSLDSVSSRTSSPSASI